MRKSYIVTGKSVVKPTDLPEGLTVEESKEKIKEIIQTKLSRRITVTQEGEEGAAHLKVEDTGQLSDVVQAFLSKDIVRKLRDTLNEILNEFQSRVITDGDGDKWFEAAEGLFHMASDVEDAKAQHRRNPLDARTPRHIEDVYGIDRTDRV